MIQNKKSLKYLYTSIYVNFISVSTYLGVFICFYYSILKKIIHILLYIISFFSANPDIFFALAEPNLLLLPVVNSTSEPELLSSSTFLMSGDEGFSESPVPESSTTEQPTVSGDEPASREAEGSESGTRTHSSPVSIEEQMREETRAFLERSSNADREINRLRIANMELRSNHNRLYRERNCLDRDIRDMRNRIERGLRELRNIRNLLPKPKRPKQ